MPNIIPDLEPPEYVWDFAVLEQMEADEYLLDGWEPIGYTSTTYGNLVSVKKLRHRSEFGDYSQYGQNRVTNYNDNIPF